ncbi:MAG: malectin domain-containing carbohydrate-binding protein [candidate division WOR-3 bacterium]
MRKLLVVAIILWLNIFLANSVMAQETAVRGSIGGTVVDTTGAVVTGAKVTITGPTGVKETTSDDVGNFAFLYLTLGTYSVKAEMTGFKAVEVKNVQVFAGRQTTLRLVLEPGQITEVVEVTAGAEGIDITSTALGANLNDTLYQSLPLQRSVTSLFYLSPGATDSLGAGIANPSISGASGLDNLYVADGVNITDSGFGGLGVFSRIYGSLTTGINTAFIKEVQVKTGGFEPQYGKSTGGIVNIITKSGSREFHGAVYGYWQPDDFEARRKHPDDFRFNKAGKLLHQSTLDFGAEAGGYVPGLRDKLFWFASFNPSIPRDFVLAPTASGLNRLLGEFQERYRTLNYSFRVTYNLTSNHTIEAIFSPDQPGNQVVFAVNCGGAQYTDKSGILYQADTKFQGGQTYKTTAPIEGTEDDLLYQSERFGTFSYNIPLPNGNYTVTLKFAEIYDNGPGRRVFDVRIEGKEVLSNLDLFARTGGRYKALDFTFPVSLTDGTLNIEFKPDVGNAKVSAILVKSK